MVTLREVPSALMILVFTGMILAMGTLFLTQTLDVTEDISGGTTTVAYQTVNDTLTGVGGFSDWIPMIVVAIAFAVILGLMIWAFSTGRVGNRGGGGMY
jgi:hypothetical protein